MVRGRWAPPPMEGKGPREGQRMAIGQLAPPAADENNTPWRHLSYALTTICHAVPDAKKNICSGPD